MLESGQGGDARLDDFRLQTPIAGSRSTFVALRNGRTHVVKTAPCAPSKALAALAELRRLEAPTDPRICSLAAMGLSNATLFIAAHHLDGYNLHYILKSVADNRGALSHHQHVCVVTWLISQFADISTARSGASYNESLLDDDGLSPDELFVTFSGAARQLDPRWTGFRRLVRSDNERSMAHMTAYAMPSTWRDEHAEHRKLTFTLGVLLWELLVGYRLFRRETLAQTLAQLSKRDVPSAHRYNPAVPRDLADFLTALLTAPRPRLLHEFAETLRDFSGLSSDTAGAAVVAWLNALFPLTIIDELEEDTGLTALEAFLSTARNQGPHGEESTTYVAAPPERL